VDWNDGLQVFTVAYTGCQSVMVAQQFIHAARLLAEIAARRGRRQDVAFLRRASAGFSAILDSDVCWDGKWFRRVLGDGLVLGSRRNRFAKIFLNTQSWAVIAGTLNPDRVRTAMDSVYERLNTGCGIRLCAPPCRTMPDGSRYPSNHAGAGENGGIFLHANVWAVIAETILGRGDRAWEYYAQILPPNLSAQDPQRYGNEPYAFSSWIYGPDHERFGTGQLSWLTGGAAWMYMLGLQSILGVRPTLDGLRIDPCIPAGWKGYKVRRRWRGTLYDIAVRNPEGISRGRVALTMDGRAVEGNTLRATRKRATRIEAVLHR
jgi:cellobiose phosphorylase